MPMWGSVDLKKNPFNLVSSLNPNFVVLTFNYEGVRIHARKNKGDFIFLFV